MIIGINGSFLRKRDSGIGQVSWNFILKLIENRKETADIQFIIYLEEDVDLDLPNGFRKKIILPFYKRDDLLRKLLWEKVVLPKEVKKDECDAFLSLYQSASIIPQIPHLMVVHDAVWKVFPEYLNNFRKKIYYHFVDRAIIEAGKILTVSKYSRKDIMKIFKIATKKISFSHIDCDPIFRSERKESVGEQKGILEKYGVFGDYIFYVGGFDVRKNVKRLIWAFGNFWKNYHQKIEIPNLVLGGIFHENLIPLVDDVPGEIEKVSEEFGVPKEKIIMTGFIKQADLPVFYSNAKVFCYPSLYEGFGLPALEAMVSGCPVIASNRSSLFEIVNKKNAFIINPQNIGKISEAIYEALENRELTLEKSIQAKGDSQNFNWDNFLKKVLDEISKM